PNWTARNCCVSSARRLGRSKRHDARGSRDRLPSRGAGGGVSRDVVVVGIPTKRRSEGGEHREACICESCGPAVLLLLSDYEARRLLTALVKTSADGFVDDGDWHGQIRFKLNEALRP